MNFTKILPFFVLKKDLIQLGTITEVCSLEATISTYKNNSSYIKDIKIENMLIRLKAYVVSMRL